MTHLPTRLLLRPQPHLNVMPSLVLFLLGLLDRMSRKRTPMDLTKLQWRTRWQNQTPALSGRRVYYRRRETLTPRWKTPWQTMSCREHLLGSDSPFLQYQRHLQRIAAASCPCKAVPSLESQALPLVSTKPPLRCLWDKVSVFSEASEAITNVGVASRALTEMTTGIRHAGII
jgi:hypothetical protein